MAPMTSIRKKKEEKNRFLFVKQLDREPLTDQMIHKVGQKGERGPKFKC